MCRRFFGFWCLRGSDTQTLLTSLEQDASSYEEGCLSGFDLLPDEVMLHIFSFLTHGGPLLDAVPLVCRRWRRLARDPRAWSGVEVWLSGAGSDHDTDARVLLRAPAVARLELMVLDAALESALRRGSLVVLGQLDARALFRAGASDKVVDAVLGVARRSRRHLRHLNLHLSAPGDGRTSNMAALLGWMQPRRCDAFQVIADLPRLRELHLSFPKERPLEYNGALRGCARGLRVLTVDRWLESPAASDDLLGDLLHGAAASLRHLRVWHKSGRGDILEKVVQCSELERLSLLGCNGVGLAELRRLRSLSNLRLSVFSPDVATALNHLADVRRVCFDELPRLQRLWVSFGWKHLQTESLADMLADCAADFKECRPDVDGKWDLL